MSQLAGKIAVVTGGNSGIGLAITQRFVAEGAFVFITARSEKARNEGIGGSHDSVETVLCDVSKTEDLDRLFETVKAMKGRVDIVVANAGVAEQASLGEISEEHYDWIFGVNTRAALFTAQKALPLMTKGGSIVLLGSLSGAAGEANLSVYAASKAAVTSFAQSWSRELADRNIRVNTLSPGPTDTPIMLNLPEPERKVLLAATPMKRMGMPKEIAAAALFLASDESSYITGVELKANGGLVSA